MIKKAKSLFDTYRHAINEASMYIISQIIIQGCSLLNVLIVSRYLGPTNLGLYSFVQSYITTSIVIISGFDFFFTYELARAENKIKVLKQYFYQKFYLTIMVMIPAIIGAFIFLPSDVFYFICLASISIIFLPFTSILIYSQVNKKAKLIAISTSFAAIISILIKTIFIYIALPLQYFAFMAGFDIVVGSIIISIITLSKDVNIRSIFKDKSEVDLKGVFAFIKIMKYSVIFSITWQMLLRIDQLLLPYLKNAYSLGVYSAAVKISEVPNVVAGVIYITLLSRIVPMIKDGQSGDVSSKKKIKQVGLMYFIMGSLATLFINLFASTIVKLLYGVKFLETIPILRIYSLSIPFLFLCYYYHSIYGALDKKRLLAITYLFLGTLNGVLVITLTKYFGLNGTAFASVITYASAVLIFSIYKYKYKL